MVQGVVTTLGGGGRNGMEWKEEMDGINRNGMEMDREGMEGRIGIVQNGMENGGARRPVYVVRRSVGCLEKLQASSILIALCARSNSALSWLSNGTVKSEVVVTGLLCGTFPRVGMEESCHESARSTC